MNNVETFVLELREHVSGGLQRAAFTAHAAFVGIDRDVSNTQRGMNDLGRTVHLDVDNSSLRHAKDDIAEVNHQMSMLQTTAAMTAGNLISEGVSSAFSFAKDTMKEVFAEGMEGDMMKKQFEVLAGKMPGDQLYDELTTLINDSIFDNELYKDARTLKQFGVATNEVMDDIRMLGDVSMGNAQSLASLSLALAQTTAAGKLAGDDLRQYINAGFNPLQVIAEKTGKNMAVLKADMSAGKISADMVRQSFIWATSEGGDFHDMLKKIGETPYGKKQAAEGNIDNAKMQLGTALLPEVSYFYDQMMPLIEQLPGELEKMRPVIAGLVHDFADLVKWTSNNTDTIGRWVKILKVGVEAYVAWKVGTVALTAANWLWVQSVGVQTAATTAATAAVVAENAALAVEAELAAALAIEYDALTVSVSGFYGAQKAGMLATAAASASLPINMTGVATGATAGAVGAAGGFAAAASAVAIPVFLVGATIAAGEALGWWQTNKGDDWWMPHEIAVEFGKSKESEQARQDYADKVKNKDLQHWIEAGGRASGTGSNILDLLGLTKADNMLSASNGRYAPSTIANVGSNRSSKAGSDTSEAIVNGGRRQVIINLNKPLIETQEYHVGSMEEAESISLRTMEENLLAILQSAAKAAF